MAQQKTLPKGDVIHSSLVLSPSPAMGSQHVLAPRPRIHVEQMARAPQETTRILVQPPTKTDLDVHFIGRVPPLGWHRTKKVHRAVIPHKPPTMAHGPMHPYHCLSPHQLPTFPRLFGPPFSFLNLNIRKVGLFPPQRVKMA